MERIRNRCISNSTGRTGVGVELPPSPAVPPEFVTLLFS
jgi:hypothetical protein